MAALSKTTWVFRTEYDIAIAEDNVSIALAYYRKVRGNHYRFTKTWGFPHVHWLNEAIGAWLVICSEVHPRRVAGRPTIL